METPFTGHNPSNILYDLSFGIRVHRESEKKKTGDSNGHTSWVHDLFSHQVSGSEITGFPLLLNELRVVRDMGSFEKGATAVIRGSKVSCLSKAKKKSSMV